MPPAKSEGFFRPDNQFLFNATPPTKNPTPEQEPTGKKKKKGKDKNGSKEKDARAKTIPPMEPNEYVSPFCLGAATPDKLEYRHGTQFSPPSQSAPSSSPGNVFTPPV